MDYSKKGIENKQNNIKSNTRRLISKARITLFRLCIVTFIFIVIVGAFAGFGFMKGLIDSAPDVSQINVVPQAFTTIVYDKEGHVIQNLAGAQSNRTFVPISELPDYVKNAFVAIEDERFYEHDGIDVRGIFRAGLLGLTTFNFDEGASTITQQLLKNQVFGGGREATFIDRVERKIQEQYLAIKLENQLDKNTILEDYINTINFGAGTLGIQTASQKYFKKDAKDLTLSEAATIAAIAQRPVYLNPINYPDDNKVRRDEILREMQEQGYCTKDEYDTAMADDVYTRIQSVNNKSDTTSYYSYFVDEIIEQVMEDLQTELGYTQPQASNLIYSGGLEIYTTQDPVIQKICDDVYADEANFPEMGISYWELTYALSKQTSDGTKIHYNGGDLLEYYKEYEDPDDLYVDDKDSKFSLLFLDKEDMQKKIDAFREDMIGKDDTIIGENVTMTIQPQSSFVVMDQYTGEVQAVIGGRGQKSGNRTLNRATDSNSSRQPGSTFKILSTYLPALDSAGFTLASIQDDSGPYYYPGTKDEVSNWTSNKDYKGLSTLRQGIYDSMNIVTVKTMAEVTPQVGFDYLKKLGFTTLVDSRKNEDGSVFSDINLPLALGGITDGVTNLELTAAYAAIANGGIYTEPTFYTKIFDHNGKLLLDKTPKRTQVMKESTAWLLTSAMEDVVKIGTGKNLKLTAIDMPVAGKTGSTSTYYDLWFSGYTPYYTASVWSGFDNNRTQIDKTYCRNIWRKIMEQIHIQKDLQKKTFTIPDSVVPVKICTKSGKLAREGICDHYIGGNTTRIEYFAKGTEPTEECDVHIEAKVCTKSNALATDKCPPAYVVDKIFLDKKEKNKTADSKYILPDKDCQIHKKSNNTMPSNQNGESEVSDPLEEYPGDAESDQPEENTNEDIPNIPEEDLEDAIRDFMTPE